MDGSGEDGLAYLVRTQLQVTGLLHVITCELGEVLAQRMLLGLYR